MVDRGTPLICDIKQNSLDDGPGIRTVIFFKGCPLSCSWCQNPEAKEMADQLVVQASKCIECKDCIDCPPEAILKGPPVQVDRARCDLCFRCIDACPAGVFKHAGTPADIEAIVKLARENAVFYRTSGGGITLSGGEPLLFPRFVLALVRRLRAEGISVVMETCGAVRLSPDVLAILPHLALIYYDVKLADPAAHQQHCGAGNALVLENLKVLVEGGTVLLPDSKDALDFKKHAYDKPLLVPRIPLVPGITDVPENLSGIASALKGLGVKLIDVLPYNPLWVDKAMALGSPAHDAVRGWMSADQLARAREALAGFRFERFK
ncbi:MAG: glycyl-radical enzyme activating protein [Candidatus Lokiarchaeota archaeon]|nr:glycyl-radical enzyme activating protein [Candidatus Lokiarchaeota archaeon]